MLLTATLIKMINFGNTCGGLPSACLLLPARFVCMHVGSQSDTCIHPRSTPLLLAPHVGKARYSYSPVDTPGFDQAHRYELSEKASIVWLSVDDLSSKATRGKESEIFLLSYMHVSYKNKYLFYQGNKL